MKSPLPWLGGKRLLSKQIVMYLNQIEHTCYIEPFMGAAHVFFRKEQVKTEVLNDINQDLTVLFRVLQNHLEEFLRFFKWALCSRGEFDRLNAQNPDSLTDIQRACRFYYLHKLCFGGRYVNRTFGTSTTSAPRLNLIRIEEELSQVHLRLSRVLIENQPWSKIIEKYDRPYSLFYLDPPYFDCEDYYGKNIFDRSEFSELSKTLFTLKGDFILSLNDHKEIRSIFSDFFIQPVKVQYSISCDQSGKRKSFPELLISNVNLKKLSKKAS
ncbi:Dam family site-specific DNA-(adenine-N6)-methyltransferase [bacterium]|nr:Dam family site-specific DNA-(adenine-N6)-methyltransferase [bacterium]